MIKLALFAVGFFFLSIFQTSFLVHYSIYGRVLNIILVIVVLYNLFESRDKKTGIYIAILGGFFLDVFSNTFIGLNIIIMLLTSVAIKIGLKKYVRIPLA